MLWNEVIVRRHKGNSCCKTNHDKEALVSENWYSSSAQRREEKNRDSLIREGLQVKVQPDGRVLREEPILFGRWLVFTSDRVGVGVVSGVISAKESESEESERFLFFRLRLWLHRLRSSENQVVVVGSRSGRIDQLQCMFPRFVIGLVLLLLLVSPTTQISLDRKRRSRKRNCNAVFTGS